MTVKLSFAIQTLDQLQDSNRPVRIDAQGRLIENDRRGFFYQNFGDAEGVASCRGRTLEPGGGRHSLKPTWSKTSEVRRRASSSGIRFSRAM